MKETLHSWEYRLCLLVSNVVLGNKAVIPKENHLISSSLPLFFQVPYPLLPNLTPPGNASDEHVPLLLLLTILPLRHKVTGEFIALCSDRSKEAAPVCWAFSFLITVALPSLQPSLPRSAHLCEQHSPSALCQIPFCRVVGYETHPVSSVVIVPFGPTFRGN